MLHIKKILLSLLLIGVNIAYAQIVVTSNADSGPGTLREAITTAAGNGTTSTDLIQFNLPGSSINDRTIRLRSALPLLTSNVIIDGSTQPSPVLGVSGAKVILEPESSPATFSALVIGSTVINNQPPTTNVEIYGLYIRRFANITNLGSISTGQGSGIVLDNRLANITIGKPGKGNVICGNLYGIWMRTSASGTGITGTSPITIQGNLIGVMDDGVTALTNNYGIYVDLSEYNISIGGDNAGEGNVIAGNATDVFVTRNINYTFRSGANIINNKIGVNYNGNSDFKNLPIFSTSSTLDMYGIRSNAVSSDINIHKNIISGHRSWGVAISNSDFVITANYIGTNGNGTLDLGNNGAIRAESNSQGVIGGTAPTDANYIGYNRFGIESVSAKPIKITRNSIFCNAVFGIGKTTTTTQAFIQLLKKQNGSVSGKASPNAEIEIFETDNCSGSCQGKIYIGSVRAGNDGRWSYTGNFGTQVTATATLATSTTSMFADAGLLDNEAVIVPVTCKGPGSITIAEPREGITFEWWKLEDDGTSGRFSQDQSVSNLAVGTYQVRIFDGCKTTQHTFSITDQILTKPIVIAPVPACNQTSFTFSASVLRGKGVVTFSWYDDKDVFKGTGSSISLPAGSYKVIAKDEMDCQEPSGIYTVAARPGPVINLSGLNKSTSVKCGFKDGFIKGITATPAVGNVYYQWYRVVSGQPDEPLEKTREIENLEGGTYRLEVKDDGTCTAIYTAFLPITNSVIISKPAPTNATCGKNNGAIKGINVTEANEYEFAGPNNYVERGNFSNGVLNFENLAPGDYRLFARSSITGCSNTETFKINETPSTVYTGTITPSAATCNLINGSLAVAYTSQTPSRYEWRNSLGNPIPGGTALGIKNLAPGTYTFHAFDVNGCETTFGPYTIENTPLLTIAPKSAIRIHDACGLKKGSVTKIQVAGGVAPYRFKWKDKNGMTVGESQDLTGVGAGEYQLEVTDQTYTGIGTCGIITSEVYIVDDNVIEVSAAAVESVRICYATDLMVSVKNFEAGTKYLLFGEDIDQGPIAENDKGQFNFRVSKTQKFYLKHRAGTCESAISSFTVEVINDNIEIANTMTPNGDGINDTWQIKGLPNYSSNLIQLYSRSGQMIFEARGNYTTPFDGTFRGTLLPAGVYYYKIDLKADCKPIAGSLTILR